MDQPLKQTSEPLFPDILWSRPVTRQTAGRLLIVGGSKNSFAHTQYAYALARSAGIGSVKVVLPVGLRPLLKDSPDCIFLPQTPSGSLSAEASHDLIVMQNETDAILLPGESGKNHETVSLLEQFITAAAQPLLLTGELVTQFLYEPTILSQKDGAYLFLSYQELQKVASALKLPFAFTSQLSWHMFQEQLYQLGTAFAKCGWAIFHDGWVHIMSTGKISSTQISGPGDESALAAIGAVLLAQNPAKPFEALSTAAWLLARIGNEASAEKAVQLERLLSSFE